jgi:tetratricopeptide (TPR) repeat protein
VLGFVAAFRDFDWTTADAEFQAALAANPNDQETLGDYAQALGARGKTKEAVDRLDMVLALDPLNSGREQLRGLMLYLDHDQVAAAAALRKSLTINPKTGLNHYFLGAIQLLNGHREEASKEFLAEQEVVMRDAGLALVNYALGKSLESDAALAQLLKGSAEIWPYGIATVYAYRGERDRAFEWLEKAYVARDSGLVTFVRGDPLLSTLHEDLRWAPFLRKMNLPE